MQRPRMKNVRRGIYVVPTLFTVLNLFFGFRSIVNSTRGIEAISDGTPGLAVRLSQQGLPLLHLLNMRRLALELGLPFDPKPLPIPGDNIAVYGAARR